MINKLEPKDLLQCLKIEIDVGRVNATRHPTLPISIYNYTPNCQFDKLWNNVNIWCRGLIVDDFGRIVALPYKKFFNLEEYGNCDWNEILDDVVEITNKEDGSLIIVVNDWDYGEIIATRGSFTSSQALAATEILKSFLSRLPKNCPIFFEYVAPTNRIVVFHSEVKLILHGVGAGGYWDYEDVKDFHEQYFKDTNIQLVQPVEINSLQDIKDNLNPNFEGVVCTRSDGERFKLKSNLYIKLHRIMTSVTEKNVFEVWYEADHSFPLDPSVPDEAYNQVREWIWSFHRKYTEYAVTNGNDIRQAITEFRRMQDEHYEVKEMRKQLAIKFPTLRNFLNLIFKEAGTMEFDKQFRKLFTYEKYLGLK